MDFDAVVIGAGPAGTVAAIDLARAGVRVLLVDRAPFPREKVCGCCINAGAAALLDDLGVGRRVRLVSGSNRALELGAGGRVARLTTPGGLALSRAVLDATLARAAVAAGARFVDGTTARVLADEDAAWRRVALTGREEQAVVRTRVVIIASGLGSRVVDGEPSDSQEVAPGSRVGVGAILSAHDVPTSYAPGRIYMACSPDGYVGLVRLEDGRLNVAAALDPTFVRHAAGPANAAQRILHHARFSALDALPDATWRGTAQLTRRRRVPAGRRILFVGDAACYVEPFTGEGIAWAMESARAVIPLALRAMADWHDGLIDDWRREHDRLLRHRRRVCRLVTRSLRHPRLTAAGVNLLNIAPFIARPVIRSANRVTR